MRELEFFAFHFLASHVYDRVTTLDLIIEWFARAIVALLDIAEAMIAPIRAALQCRTYSQNEDEFFHVDDFQFTKL